MERVLRAQNTSGEQGHLPSRGVRSQVFEGARGLFDGDGVLRGIDRERKKNSIAGVFF